MDLDAFLNLALVVCACILAIGVVYRMLRGKAGPAGEELEQGEDLKLAAEGPRTAQVAIPPRPGRVTPTMAQGTEVFRKAATENPDQVRRSARRMVDYALARGGTTHIRPEVLDKIALQFGLLEVVLRHESRDEEGRPCDIPEERMSDILRESFRLAAFQARK